MDSTVIDVSDIDGTNCYLKEEAKPEIRSLVSASELKGIHFIGSGNYHYISYFFLELIRRDFSLLLIDNHTDMQRSAFGDILSCGSWVMEAVNRLENLKYVYILGASAEHILEVQPIPENVCIIENAEEISKDLPLYISIDKDVLSREYSITDWDQGDMSLGDLVAMLDKLRGYDVLGVDICGDSKNPLCSDFQEINYRTNKSLIRVCKSLL